MTQSDNVLFADGVAETTIAHGVVRVRVARESPTGGLGEAAGLLVVPLVRLPLFVEILKGVLSDAEARVKALASASAPPPAPRP